MDALRRAYHVVFVERADPRVKDWFLMTSPLPIAVIATIYMVIIKLVLPAFMKNRQPYELRSLIKWYNIVQIVSNAIVTWGIMTSGWTTTYHFGCMLPDYSMNPEAIRMLRYLWWTMILKIMELVETAFFILRKKKRQASFLHIYHHVSTLGIIWAAVKYVGGRKSWGLTCAGLLSYGCCKPRKPAAWGARAGWGPAGKCHLDYMASPTLCFYALTNKNTPRYAQALNDTLLHLRLAPIYFKYYLSDIL